MPLISEINFVESSGSGVNEIILFLRFNTKAGEVVALISSLMVFVPSILEIIPNGEVVLSFCCIGVKRLNLGPSCVVSTFCLANENGFVNAFEAEP